MLNKKRASFYGATICYLIKDDKVLFLKFNKKWGQVFAPPGGKIEEKETPLMCIKREFYEETGLELINPKIKGISCWNDPKAEGFIYIFVANDYTGEFLDETPEGKLEWVPIKDTENIKQFEQNKIFNKYVFEEGSFEGKFDLDINVNVISYEINKI